MKLLLCETCGDVVKLKSDLTACSCGKAKGKYLEDGWHAVKNNHAILIGLNNNHLRAAIYSKNDSNPSIGAWVMTDNPRVSVDDTI